LRFHFDPAGLCLDHFSTQAAHPAIGQARIQHAVIFAFRDQLGSVPWNNV
jgi:hypothetical protein